MSTTESTPTVLQAEAALATARDEVTRREETLAKLDAQMADTSTEVARIEALDDTQIGPADLDALDLLPRRLRRLEGERLHAAESLATTQGVLAGAECAAARAHMIEEEAEVVALVSGLEKEIGRSVEKWRGKLTGLRERGTSLAAWADKAGERAPYFHIADVDPTVDDVLLLAAVGGAIDQRRRTEEAIASLRATEAEMAARDEMAEAERRRWESLTTKEQEAELRAAEAAREAQRRRSWPGKSDASGRPGPAAHRLTDPERHELEGYRETKAARDAANLTADYDPFAG